MFPINFPATQVVHVDPDVWKACAGANFVVPQIGSLVYYFPEGHAKLYSDDSPPTTVFPIFRCRVYNVRYLADRASDDVFSAVLLQLAEYDFRSASPAPALGSGSCSGVKREGSRIDSFMKTLTKSDANNGGAFSVPRQCGESIFPALNYNEVKPVQNLTITDVQGVDWVFRHVFRGTPKRHLLTTGWSKFCNHKKLIAGDGVIFMRDNLTGRLHIGIRRLDNGDGRRFGSQSLRLSGGGDAGELVDEFDDGFWRTGNRRVFARFIEEAVMHAAQKKPFEIILHPRDGFPNFLMNVDVVDRALSWRWVVGMPVKMPFRTGDESSGLTWLRGHVSMVVNALENGKWQGSPWKMLQVTWVEPEHLQNVERVSPWQVEYAEPSAPLQPTHPLTDLREHICFQPLVAKNREQHSMIGQVDLPSGLLNSILYNSNAHLASMQGARHFPTGCDTHQICSDEMFQRSELSLLQSRITELNTGGHWPGNFSAESHSSLRSFGTEIGNLQSPQGGISSIQLFGKLIYVNNPVASLTSDAGCLETDSISEGNHETVGMYNRSCVH